MKLNTLVLSGVLFISLGAQAAPTVVSKTKVIKPSATCVMEIQYPTSTDPKIQAINKVIEKDLLDVSNYLNEYQCTGTAGFTLKSSFEVKLLSDQTYSVYTSEVAYTDGDAHPYNKYKAYNYSLKTGKKILLASLFINENMAPLEAEMAKSLIKQGVITGIDEFETVKREYYEFYLTATAIVVINLFEQQAVQSVEAVVPYLTVQKYRK